MSRSHTVVSGDTFGRISTRYYGVAAKYPQIIQANPQLTGRSKESDGTPRIFPGNILVIPDDMPPQAVAEDETVKTEPDAEPDELTLKVGNDKFRYFTGYEITQNIDVFDVVNLDFPFDNTRRDYRELFRPFLYRDVEMYIGGTQLFNGTLLAPSPDIKPDGKVMTLAAYPKCGIINDCTPPISSNLDFSGLNISQIATQLCRPFGIGVQIGRGTQIGNPFEETSINPDQAVLAYIIDLAKQRGLLTTNALNGDLLAWKAREETPVSTITESDPRFVQCTPNFNDQGFYSDITGIIPETETSESQQYTVTVPYLKRKGVFRPITKTLEDTDSSSIQDATRAMAGRMLGMAANYTLTLRGIKRDADNRWIVNTQINLHIPSAAIYRETTFLIKSLTIPRKAEESDVIHLNIVLPGSYTGVIPEVFPWEE